MAQRESSDPIRSRGAFPGIVMTDRLAAVQHERNPKCCARDGNFVNRLGRKVEALGVRIELAGSEQSRRSAALQLVHGARPGGAHGREAGEPIGVRSLHLDQMVVDVRAVLGVGERPAEAHRPIDPGRIHHREQLVRCDDRPRPLVTHVEPWISGGEPLAGIAHGCGQDVDVAVDDHPSHRPCANIQVPANMSAALAPSITGRARG